LVSYSSTISVRSLFYVDMFFFLCFFVLVRASFYVGLMIYNHICQPRAVWQAALMLSSNEIAQTLKCYVVYLGVRRWGTEETRSMTSKLVGLFTYEVILLCEFLGNFLFVCVFEDSFWDMMSLQTLQGSGAVFHKNFADGCLLASKNNQGSLHLCSHKYSVSGWYLKLKIYIFELILDSYEYITAVFLRLNSCSGPTPPHCWGLKITIIESQHTQ